MSKKNSNSEFFPTAANVKSAKKTETDKAERCASVNKFIYQDNSCFMDSLMFALFAFPTDFVNKYILDHSAAGADAAILQIMRGINQSRIGANSICNNALRNSAGIFFENSRNVGGDPAEFFKLILDKLNIKSAKVVSAVTGEEIEMAPCIMLNVGEDMPTNLLEDGLNGVMTELGEDEVVYKVDDNFVSFEINRQVEKQGQTVISRAYFQMQPEIAVTNSEGVQTLLSLNQVIVVIYGKKINHYVCYFKCNDYWYLYDDTESKIEKIGEFHVMNEEAGDGCVLLIYSDINNTV